MVLFKRKREKVGDGVSEGEGSNFLSLIIPGCLVSAEVESRPR